MIGDIESAVLSVSECAKMLKISRGSAYLGCLTGEIPHIKIGRRILIPKASLVKMLSEAGQPKSV